MFIEQLDGGVWKVIERFGHREGEAPADPQETCFVEYFSAPWLVQDREHRFWR